MDALTGTNRNETLKMIQGRNIPDLEFSNGGRKLGQYKDIMTGLIAIARRFKQKWTRLRQDQSKRSSAIRPGFRWESLNWRSPECLDAGNRFSILTGNSSPTGQLAAFQGSPEPACAIASPTQRKGVEGSGRVTIAISTVRFPPPLAKG